MSFFLTLQATYDSIEYALSRFDTFLSSQSFLAQGSIPKTDACKLLMTSLNNLLTVNHISWNNITCIIVNQGPAPFTTLRAVIATVNGISFATQIPLIGIDGLNAFAQEPSGFKNSNIEVSLLNAFAGDVYFAIIENNNIIQSGWNNGIQLLENIAQRYPKQPIIFKGNGVALFQNNLNTLFQEYALIPSPNPHYCSLKTVATRGITQYTSQTKSLFHISPLYLKTIAYKAST